MSVQYSISVKMPMSISWLIENEKKGRRGKTKTHLRKTPGSDLSPISRNRFKTGFSPKGVLARPTLAVEFIDGPCGSRTYGPLVKNQLLYRMSYRTSFKKNSDKKILLP